MPRSIWNGTISFGMVHVPIKLYSATRSKSIHFHEVHDKDGARIEHRRICPADGSEVPSDEIVKGYELSAGEYVVLEKDEIKAAAGTRSKVIDVEDFVEAADIDPVYYERTYHVGAREGSEDAYRLLHEALRRTGRAGLGRFTYHNREYLAAVRALDDVLALHTMRFHDEVVRGEDLEIRRPERAPTDREVKMAGRLVESLHEPFRPHKYEDTYREAVLGLIERKAAGEEIAAPEPEPEGDEAPDLMAALQASLEG